jgi:hypothetical protein
MNGVTKEEHDLHADSIAEAKLLWSASSSTRYIESIRRSLAVLRPFRTVLSKQAIAVDPRVSASRDPIDAIIGNAFRAGRDLTTREASGEPSNAEALKLMMGGRPRPPTSQPLPKEPSMSENDKQLLVRLNLVLWSDKFKPELARSIIRSLYDNAEITGYNWAGSFLHAVGTDSREKLANRLKLLTAVSRTLAGDTPYGRSARGAAAGIYRKGRPHKDAFKLMGFAEEFKHGNSQLSALEGLLQDAIDKGIRNRVREATIVGEASAGAEHIGESHIPIVGPDVISRMVGGKPFNAAAPNGRTENIRSKKPIKKPTPLKVSSKKNLKNLNELGPYYDLIVEELAFSVSALAKRGFIPVIVTNDLKEGVEIRFDTRVGTSTAVGSIHIDGPKRSKAIAATSDHVTILMNYYEKVPVGSHGWYARHFTDDPLAETYRSKGFNPLHYLVLQNTALSPIDAQGKPEAREVTSPFMVAAWSHLSGCAAEDPEPRGAVSRRADGLEILKFNGCCGKEFVLLCKGSNSWRLSDQDNLVAAGSDGDALIDVLDRVVVQAREVAGELAYQP